MHILNGRQKKRLSSMSLWMMPIAIVYFLVLCYLSYHRPLSANLDFFPDERWRILLPLYFYEHGVLPTGHETSVRIDLWGFSYASYPLMLTTLVGGILMKLMSFITADPDLLVFAARLVSIVSATVVAWFSMKIGFRLFGRPAGWIFGLLVSMMPQVIFCGLYFNNDIVALAGSAMIMYSWILGFQDGWRYSSVCLLSAGVVIVSLSYYNAYSWILLSIIVYFVIWFRRGGQWGFPNVDLMKKFGLLTALAIGIVVICVAPFFVRNAVLNNGDFLGLSTVEQYGNLYGADGFSPATRLTPQRLGMTLGQMLTTDHYLGVGNSWLEYTVKSFIGVFGAMSVFLPTWIYIFYIGVFIGGGILWIVSIIYYTLKKEYFFSRRVLDLMMFFNCLIVLALALIYSYATDYQAQGRYILPLLLSAAYCAASGWSFLGKIIRVDQKYSYGIIGLFSGIVLCMAMISFSVYYMQV